ncbi:acyl-CoA synthetase family member 3, mitochondrial isoform X1 [Melanaphis sacchari]|uniref:Acyl-CoA synthetase family member 3, mitochondrial n=2 Tax=Melanaphis sacchari TaxID=742174 RepID=A0A2H8TKU3_9HEMI|nr:acyl-CoA synthetase family member 3, mitochondrial isoform X1 [Melanaphis sacchari]XP_025207432.1 acyl-CoA synthetase family member 3, mitochondrial isoform X1 [Melanaphis sacchari]XP_025207441.1 acyl-CoA synthetase family member 3, mitochondrial isoform X1 [Melanaphis sacchari]XP_025207451.1 acyl-CoA synthetase family member 3, mitochondrial isoform X1 [Melanaphis sacchari]
MVLCRKLLYRPFYSCCIRQLSSEAFKNIPKNETSLTPIYRLASQWPKNIAIVDKFGEHTYSSIFNSSVTLSKIIEKSLHGEIQERVAILCPNDASYVVAQWASWMSGQIVVPLSPLHPASMLEYFINDSDAKVILTTAQFENIVRPLAEKFNQKYLLLEDHITLDFKPLGKTSFEENNEVEMLNTDNNISDEQFFDSNAMIIYTSGSTGSPKGVLLTHNNLNAQINCLKTAWNWNNKDVILHALPLNHIHGIVNALMCPLHTGARCVMLPKFNAADVWTWLLAIEQYYGYRVNMFMGVPTMYVKLIENYEKMFEKNDRMVEYIKAVCSQKIRLMVSGSAPLPSTLFNRWEQITGHKLLERYGMSEIGMALSNPLNGERKPGFVGQPLPGVNVRIVKDDTVLLEGYDNNIKIINSVKHDSKEGYSGDLQIKGKNVFKEYWRKPESTKKEFTEDGWFKTGDSVRYVDDSFQILGRTSIDIIKTGGYKVSALFVETIMLQNKVIKDIAVVGLPDSTWGQRIGALIAIDEQAINVEHKKFKKDLKIWAETVLPSYSVPTVIYIVDEVPRNALGKVDKKSLLKNSFSKYLES